MQQDQRSNASNSEIIYDEALDNIGVTKQRTVTEAKIDTIMKLKCEPFYLNILLLNKDEVVTKTVANKTGMSATGFFSQCAGFAANQVITDEKIVQGLSDNLIEGVDRVIYEMGITASFEKRFQYGPFVVIRVQVEEIDTIALILAAKGTKFASAFSAMLVAVDHLGMTKEVISKVDKKILDNINVGMMKRFKEAIPAKLAEKGIAVECVTCSREEEADFFFNMAEKWHPVT